MTSRALLVGFAVAVMLSQPAIGVELPDYPDDEVAGVAVNYTEAEVGDYTLPDPLRLSSGEAVATPDAWREQRRPELHALIESQQFGRAPGKPAKVRAEVTEGPTPAFDGLATREQVTIHLGDDDSAPSIKLLVYTPAKLEQPAPVLLSISFVPNNQRVDDPAVHVGQRWDRQSQQRVPAEGPGRFGRLPVRLFVENGLAIATLNYADIEIDAPDAAQHGIRGAHGENLADDQWGAIAAWCWGISRVVDYFETDPLVDANRVAITGISRLGKTVLWAGANDQRIAAVIASCSGEGGAALSRRNYGETIAHLASPERYAYQFAKNYQQWGPEPRRAPFDAHELIALIAPRPLLLQTGTSDKWSDPKGEFLAAKAATPVYELLGQTGVDAAELPPAGQRVGGTLSYYMHDGGHGMVPGDWEVFVGFLREHLAD